MPGGAGPREVYCTIETDFMRSAMAMTEPLTERSMGAVDVRKEASLRRKGVEGVSYSKE